MRYESDRVFEVQVNASDSIVIQEVTDIDKQIKSIDFRIYSKYLNRFTHRGFRLPLTQFKAVILPFLNVKYGKDQDNNNT